MNGENVMLSFCEVTRQFRGPEGQVCAVRNISLSVNQGELVAVQGPSGSGKTTLLLMAGGLLKPTEGTVSFGGGNIYALTANQRSALRAKQMGFVFQQFHLIPYLTVWRNVLSPAGASRQPDARSRAKELIHHFNLEHRSKHVPSQLSTGERQRTALARALLNRPGIILADEPTGNLDEANADVVLKYLSEFASAGGAVLLVTHDARAAGYADRTMHMDGGSIVNA